MKKIRMRYMVGAMLFLLLFVSIITNPSKQDYLLFSEKQSGVPTPAEVEIERINFYLFSTYTPFVVYENGITHLGIFGNFIQISDGQFDYPWWLEFFS